MDGDAVCYYRTASDVYRVTSQNDLRINGQHSISARSLENFVFELKTGHGTDGWTIKRNDAIRAGTAA